MRVLLITTYFKPDIAANGILLAQLAEALARRGVELTVVTSMPHYATNRIWDAYRGRLWTRERAYGCTIYRVYLHVPARKGKLVGRVLNYLSFNVLSTLVALFAGRHDVILVASPPLTNGVFGWLLSRLKRAPLIYNVQDIYSDIAVRLGILRNPRLIRLFRRMEAFVYRKSTAVTVISQGFWRNLRAKGVPAAKLRVIPNFVDDELLQMPPRHNAFSREHELDDKFVVLFAGNVGLSQGLHHVLEAAQQLTDLPDVHFLIVGNGAARAKLMEQAKPLHNVSFLPYQPHETVTQMYATADVGLVPLRHGIAQESVPSKVYTIMGAGRPIVAAIDRDSDTWEFIQNSQAGLCVQPENAAELAAAIRKLYADRALAAQMGRNGRASVQAHHTTAHIAEKYLALFAELAHPESSRVDAVVGQAAQEAE